MGITNKDCVNCTNCKNFFRCVNCENCVGCFKCRNCINCEKCDFTCIDCVNCYGLMFALCQNNHINYECKNYKIIGEFDIHNVTYETIKNALENGVIVDYEKYIGFDENINCRNYDEDCNGANDGGMNMKIKYVLIVLIVNIVMDVEIVMD